MQGNLSSLARLAVVCVAAVAVFVAWLATPGTANIGVSFFYAVSVGLAAWWWGWRGAVLAIVASAGLYALGAEIQAVAHFWPTLIVRLAAFYVVAFVAIALKRRFAALEHSAEELEAIRAALTPARLPDLRNVDAAAVFVPSELGVSGDFYLLAERPRRGRQLVSATCVRYSPDESLLTWASAGHPPPLALPGIEEMEVEGDTFLLGAQADLELRNASVALEEGEGVLVYTDGATDVRCDGALLGLDGLSRLLAPLAGLPARELADRAEEAILAWAEGTIRDDLCLLVLRPRR